MAHTPGPWKFLLNKSEGYSVYSGDDLVVWQIGGVEKIDDALLIAAAPDLLSALINIVSMAEAAHWDKATTGRQLLLDDAKKAISKAEGKE